jgi:hypothetical protein
MLMCNLATEYFFFFFAAASFLQIRYDSKDKKEKRLFEFFLYITLFCRLDKSL